MKNSKKLFDFLFVKHRNGRHKKTNRNEPGETLTAAEKRLLEKAIKQASETHKTSKPPGIEYRRS